MSGAAAELRCSSAAGRSPRVWCVAPRGGKPCIEPATKSQGTVAKTAWNAEQ